MIVLMNAEQFSYNTTKRSVRVYISLVAKNYPLLFSQKHNLLVSYEPPEHNTINSIPGRLFRLLFFSAHCAEIAFQ